MKYNYWTALWLCVVIFIIFIVQKLVPVFTDLFRLDTTLVSIRPWTLITAIFLHSGIVHLLSNLFALALFGSILEHIIGTKKFLILFFISGLAASFASLFYYDKVLGASGAIFGIIGMLGILRPKMTVWIYHLPMPMILALVVWAAGDLLGYFAPSPGDHIANLAHLSGLGVGVIVGFYYYKHFRERKRKKEDVYIDEEKVKEWEKSF